MTVSSDGRQVLCDGEGCSARADVPVALHPQLGGGTATAEQQIEGWLIVAGGGEWRHYCPACLVAYLAYLAYLEDRGESPAERRHSRQSAPARSKTRA